MKHARYHSSYINDKNVELLKISKVVRLLLLKHWDEFLRITGIKEASSVLRRRVHHEKPSNRGRRYSMGLGPSYNPISIALVLTLFFVGTAALSYWFGSMDSHSSKGKGSL